jgi:hypothetical protein
MQARKMSKNLYFCNLEAVKMKICIFCGSQMPDGLPVCPECRHDQSEPPKRGSALVKGILISAAIVFAVVFLEVSVKKANPVTRSAATSAPSAATTSAQNAALFEIIDTELYSRNGSTVIIQTVRGKKDAAVRKSVIAKDKDGKVIGKAEDSIMLTAGKETFFRLDFGEQLPPDATFASATAKEFGHIGTRNAVEMVTSNQNGKYLYITFRQIAPQLGAFAKFKILFYSGGKIVADVYHYFSGSAPNLQKEGDEDVAQISVPDQYDDFRVFFEP